MKIITISKIGYNQPSQANWSYRIWKIDTIDTNSTYNMAYTVKETFGGDSRLRNKFKEQTNFEILETKGVPQCPKVTGVSKMLDIESDEILAILTDFIKK